MTNLQIICPYCQSDNVDWDTSGGVAVNALAPVSYWNYLCNNCTEHFTVQSREGKVTAIIRDYHPGGYHPEQSERATVKLFFEVDGKIETVDVIDRLPEEGVDTTPANRYVLPEGHHLGKIGTPIPFSFFRVRPQTIMVMTASFDSPTSRYGGWATGDHLRFQDRDEP